MKIYPAKNYVLLKRLGEVKTKSGIIAPEAQDMKKPEAGRVYKVGLGKQPFPVIMKEGDIVLYKKYMANEITVPGASDIINPVAFEDLTTLIREETSE